MILWPQVRLNGSVSHFGPWTRGDGLDLAIFLLLLIWFSLDRCNLYFLDILEAIRKRKKHE